MVLPDPGWLEMNFVLGSSWPTYQPLSMKRLPLPLVTRIGSVHRSPASRRTVPYFLLQPLQSSSLTLFGVTAPLAAVFALAAAAVAVAVAPAEPLTVSWKMTAMPMAGTTKSRHLRQPACGGFCR